MRTKETSWRTQKCKRNLQGKQLSIWRVESQLCGACDIRSVDIGGKDIGSAAAAMTEKLDAMDLDEGDDSNEADEAPIFTPELARLKAKEKGQ